MLKTQAHSPKLWIKAQASYLEGSVQLPSVADLYFNVESQHDFGCSGFISTTLRQLMHLSYPVSKTIPGSSDHLSAYFHHSKQLTNVVDQVTLQNDPSHAHKYQNSKRLCRWLA